MDWPQIEPVECPRLVLEPLTVEHADEMARALADPRLYEYTGGEPPSTEQLRERYAALVLGRSADGSQCWLNWVIRLRASGRAAGYVQATLEDEAGTRAAEVAWVVSVADQGHGVATEAAVAMVEWLRAAGAGLLVAHVHPDHPASKGVALAVGLRATDAVVDGEVRWERRL